MHQLNVVTSADPNQVSVREYLMAGFVFAVGVLFAHPLGAVDVPFSARSTIVENFIGPFNVHVADVDSDGDFDVLAAGRDAGQIVLAENTAGDGSEWDIRVIKDNLAGAVSVFAADVDGDGDKDVLGAAQDADVMIWFENELGDGRVWSEHVIDNAFDGARSVFAADMDGDLDLDVIGAACLGQQVTWWENLDGYGYEWDDHLIRDDFLFAASVRAVDLDNDGDLDVVGAAGWSDDVAWWENAGGDPPSWIEHMIDDAVDGAGGLFTADIDGDGDLDVLCAADVAKDITWWENNLDVSADWEKHVVDGDFDGAYSVNAGDIDGDGDTDILGAAYTDDEVTWWENTDHVGGSWTKHSIDGTFDGAISVVTVDIDGDTDIDVVAAGRDVNAVALWENLTPAPQVPRAEFSWDPDVPVEFETVQFDDESIVDSAFPVTFWEWDFGDGFTSEGQSPTHVFDEENVVDGYSVTLRVVNDNGEDQITKSVRVVERQIPLVDFSWAPANPTAGESVEFLDGSSFPVDSDPASHVWSWTIDDNGIHEYDVPDPTHTFVMPGSHDVRLTVANSHGSHSAMYAVNVETANPGTPYIMSVTRAYPGVFLQMDPGTVENTFDATVDWQETSPGFVRFSVQGVPLVDVYPDEDEVFSQTFDMATDFVPAWTGSTVTATPYYQVGSDFLAGQSLAKTIYVFPYPAWLDLLLPLMPDVVTITPENGDVITSIYAEFPVPHLVARCSLECIEDPDPIDCADQACSSIPDWVPLIGGEFTMLETYAAFEGSVSSALGIGNLELYGQTGFYAMESAVLGAVSGSGEFTLNADDGFAITQTSFNLHLEGVLSKSVTLSDIPQVAPITDIPIIGPVIKEITDRATLSGQIAPYLDLSATWAQNVDGDLVFAHGEGTLGLDLKAMLALDLGVLNLSAWVAGGGSFTLGLPEDPLIRAAEIHAQLGLEASLSYTFKIFWKTFTLSLSKTATLDIGCDYVYDRPDPWGCYAELDLMKRAARLLDEAGVVRVIEHDYRRFGEYAVFKAEPVARTKSAKVPVAVAKTKLVENLFPGASPAIAEAGPDMLLVWVHDDTADPDLQSTEIAWSFGVWDTSEPPDLVWSDRALVADDTRAEFDPVLGENADGNIVAAWLRIKDEGFSATIETAAELPLFYKRMDVVGAVFDPSSQYWSVLDEPITDDDSMDTDLRLVADESGNIMLTWLSNEEGHFFPVFNPDDPTDPPPSYLNYSFWGAEGFDTPLRLPDELWGVSSHASAISGDHAVVLIPRDPNVYTIGDEVIDLYEWDGATWSGPTPFATDAAGSRAPTVVFDNTGEGHVVWLQGDDLVKATLSDPTPSVLRAGSASLAFLGAQLVNNPGGNITLTWQETVDNQPADIFAMIYDPITGTWSEDRRLTDKADLSHPDHLVHQASATYDSDSLLHAAYVITEITRADEIVEIPDDQGELQEWEMTNIPVEGQTNLMVMTHELIDDLAVEDHDLEVAPIPDDPDDRLKATLTVHNAGFFATDIPDVDLYLGDPNEDGEWIGACSAIDPPMWFAAGSTNDYVLEFDPPTIPGNLVAVVDGSNVIQEEWEDNNAATWYRENHAPVAVVIAEVTTGRAPLVVEFNGSSSFDPDGDEITMRWAFADGTAGEQGSQVTHRFENGGRYPVTLSVTDDHGAVGSAVVMIDLEPSPAELLAEAVMFFDNGSIAGVGRQPRVAARRLDMYRDLLTDALDSIGAGDVAGACGALGEAVDRSDGRKPPLDYIEGDDVPALNQMLVDIMTVLGC